MLIGSYETFDSSLSSVASFCRNTERVGEAEVWAGKPFRYMIGEVGTTTEEHVFHVQLGIPVALGLPNKLF